MVENERDDLALAVCQRIERRADAGLLLRRCERVVRRVGGFIPFPFKYREPRLMALIAPPRVGGGDPDETEQPSLETRPPAESRAPCEDLQIRLLQGVLRARRIAVAAMQRPNEALAMKRG